ncbi:MAG TPA: FISUMP domain-containing protein [Bacteroidales bacterium]|nr:FISUMP domain-containing protein [Bacteroidales bacterium]
MKKYRLIFLLAVSLSGSALLRAQVAINAGGAGADPSAALDVSFPDKGLLPPRVALQSALLPDPVVSPAGGLIVYNTATAGTPPGNVIPGFYYWMGGRWNAMSLPAGTAAGDLVYWNGNQWVSVSPGLPGQFLRMSQEGLPYWTGSAFPTVTTRDTSGNITQNSASSGGEVTSDGGASVYSRGVCWDTVSNPVAGGNHTSDGSGVGAFTSSITGLSSGTTYHVRAYATNNIGTSYGSDVTFTTQEYIAPPTVETTGLSNITSTSAASGGNVTSAGGAPVTARGVCWSTSSSPTISNNHTTDGTGTGTFTSTITGLQPSTLYYVRAYATNSGGTSYGGQLQFTTAPGSGGSPCPGTPSVTWQGSTYNTVLIGLQCWLKSNLNVGTRINGTLSQTNNGVMEKYCYNDLESNCSIYGGLYQWAEAVQYLNSASNTSSWSPVPTGFVQGICPSGWHVPTLTDWNTLIAALGGESVAGGKLKEAGFTHWMTPNTGATNESGFTGLPGGMRDVNGTFVLLTQDGFFWSSTESGPTAAYDMKLDYSSAAAALLTDLKTKGFSVRCLKNN